MEKQDFRNFSSATAHLILPDNYQADVEDILGSYSIQLIEEKRRLKKELELLYFFDSYDVINLLQGVNAYVTSTHIEFDRYEKDKLKNLVYAFVFQGLYKPTVVHMLEPHKIEFFNKIYKDQPDLKDPSREDSVRNIQEVLSRLIGPGLFQGSDLSSLSTDDRVRELIQNSRELFRVNFLLQYQSWRRRLKHLQRHELVHLGSPLNELQHIADPEIFKLINAGFEQVRPTKTESNFYDALAFYQLHELLELHKNDPSQPLPVFFASSPSVRQAIRHIRHEKPELFSYQLSEQDDRLIPIVRDALFFALEPIFTVDDEKGTEITESFFEQLREAQPLIRNLLEDEYKKLFNEINGLGDNFRQAKQEFEQNVREIIEVQFAHRIWVEKKDEIHFIDQLQEDLNWIEEDQEEVEIKIQQHLDESLQDAEKSLQRSRHLAAIIRAFNSVNQDVEKILRKNADVGEVNIFKDLALIRFGMDSRKFKHLQQDIDSLIHHPDPLSGATPVLYRLLSNLSVWVDSPKKRDDFLNGIALAWILNKYNLIIELCRSIEDEELEYRYETALIYAASLVAHRRTDQSIQRTQEIINCVLKNKNENYKVWIGVSYLYYRMWEILNPMHRDLPEMNPKEWKKIARKTAFEDYVIEGALKYARQAYDYLKQKIEQELSEKEFKIYLTYYLYILNNLIYYTTKSGDQTQFEDIHAYVTELKRYELHEAEWQGRFFDTLGWYSLRQSYHVDEPRFRSIYIQQAEHYLVQAREQIASPRDYTIYAQLQDAILTAQRG